MLVAVVPSNFSRSSSGLSLEGSGSGGGGLSGLSGTGSGFPLWGALCFSVLSFSAFPGGALFFVTLSVY